MKKRVPWSLIVILVAVIIGFILIFFSEHSPEEDLNEFVECISTKATLYTQLGCHACEKQEELFGENYENLEIVDCFFDPELCEEITGTPTWEIGDERYLGVIYLEDLARLTKCELPEKNA